MAELPQTLTSDPTEMFALGRRHMAVKDYSAAASCLSKACELLGEKYGQQADECGEACFWYGRSLLGLAREESGVLGDGLPGNDGNDENQEEEEDEDDNDAEENNETDNVNEEKTENPSKDKIVEGESEQKMDVVSSEEASDVTKPGSSAIDIDQPGPSSGVASSSAAADGELVDNEDEEVENLQLAWEVFELARDIFLKRGERGKKELADVYLHLGEVSLESEVYDKAISDMSKSLELFKELYNPDDRRIAETHYQIGLAHSLSNGFDDAITHFKNAVEILENRIKNLQSSSASEDETVKKNFSVDPFYTIESEIKELTELLPEIREKIQDTIDYKAEAIKSMRETLNLNKTNGESSKTNGCSSSSTQHEEKKASDISHLIKRKRKPDDDAVEECSAPKKIAN